MKELDILVERAANIFANKAAVANLPTEVNNIRFNFRFESKEYESLLKLLVYAAYNKNIYNSISNNRIKLVLNYIKKKIVKQSASVGENDELQDLGSYDGTVHSACYRYAEQTGDYKIGEGLVFEVLCFMAFSGTRFAEKNDPIHDLLESNGGIQCKWTSSKDKTWNNKFGGYKGKLEKGKGIYKQPFKIASGNYRASFVYTISKEGIDRINKVLENKDEKIEQIIEVGESGEFYIYKGFVSNSKYVEKKEDVTKKINEQLKVLKEQLTDTIRQQLKSPKDFGKLIHNMGKETGVNKQEYEMTAYKNKEATPEATVDNKESYNYIKNYNGSLTNTNSLSLDKTNFVRMAIIKPDMTILKDGKPEVVNTAYFGNAPMARMKKTIGEWIKEVIGKYDNIISFGLGKGEIKISDVANALKNSGNTSVLTYFNY